MNKETAIHKDGERYESLQGVSKLIQTDSHFILFNTAAALSRQSTLAFPAGGSVISSASGDGPNLARGRLLVTAHPGHAAITLYLTGSRHVHGVMSATDLKEIDRGFLGILEKYFSAEGAFNIRLALIPKSGEEFGNAC
ncbi:uncharacterized protein MELLADRAFT_114676 [Melampsora larici-populina 98AG31]|uniref:Uncharacterized protein n=1 Tax=Melampsora larici-populina (strain 98AG31 / pathotype 3-4-7) TaxID=747676 RepID=F4SEC9_MELLP|nr:uncharacterized protein MELLADRAFT_114676 [Melampsora larici-populina 98AG31]EGF96996.1 hypothetical protein MELLADRAFT_114676 [Melampsora larici-populina 98AG31]